MSNPNIRQIISQLNPYEKWIPLSTVREANEKTGAAAVYQLANNIRRKVYPIGDPGRALFENEKLILTTLKDQMCSCVPRLMHLDATNRTLYVRAPPAATDVPNALVPSGDQKAIDQLFESLASFYRVEFKGLASDRSNFVSKWGTKWFMIDHDWDPKLWVLKPLSQPAPIQSMST